MWGSGRARVHLGSVVVARVGGLHSCLSLAE